MIGIYKITNPEGRVYIGQSVDVQTRFSTYLKSINNFKNQVKLYNSMQKYGSFEHVFEIIEECSIQELNARERYWQDFYNVLEGGLNLKLTQDGDKSGHLSEETKNRISQALQGREVSEEVKQRISKTRIEQDIICTEETRVKLSTARSRRVVQPMQGKLHTEETKQKMRKAAMGILKSEEHKQKISDTLKGRKLSEETKRRMSESKKRKV